jgi:predicted N-acyltransferase
MSYQVKITNNINDIDPVAWDKLGANVPFSDLRWTRLAMRLWPEFRPNFILLYERQKLVGRAVAAFSKDHGMSIHSPVKRGILNAILNRYPLLQCQAPPFNLTASSGLILPKDGEWEGLARISDALRMLGRSRPTSFIGIGWMTEAEHQVIRRSDGFFVQEYNTTVLRNRWSSFEEYIQSLGKTARKDFRQHNNRAKRMGITIEVTHQFAQYGEALQNLIANVDQHYRNIVTQPITPETLSILQDELPDKSVMLLAWVDGKLAGCGYLMHDKGVLKPTLLGKDYQYPHVYFQIFYAMLRYAIDNHFELVRGGVGGAYQFKHRLGFEDQPSYIAYTSPQPLVQRIAPLFADGMNADSLNEIASKEQLAG